MKITLKNTIFTIFAFSLFFTQQAFAEREPTVDTLSAIAISDDQAFLRGEFNSRDNNYFPTNQPLVWFEYGRDRNDLDDSTLEIAKVKGNYIVSQGISDLRDDTKYYYRAVIRFDGDTDYGEKLYFYTDQEDNNEDTNTQTNQNQQEDNNFLSPSELLGQYFDGTTNQNPNTSSGETGNGGEIGSRSPNIFSWAWWRGDKDEDQRNSAQDNNVYTDEEIAERLAEQERYGNSAANNDELGEVVEYNTNYRNYGTQRTNGFPVLFFIVLVLVIVLILIYLILRKRRRLMYQVRRRLSQRAPGQMPSSKYHIPVRRDVVPGDTQEPASKGSDKIPSEEYLKNPPKE